MDYAKLQPYIAQGLIREQRHPQQPAVAIFNYTPACQFSGAWDEITMACRGLILNTETGEIVARPFAKFFNLSEHTGKGLSLPAEEPHITEKVDGSLGVIFWLNDMPCVATRGSFASEQALWATAWLRANIDTRKLWRGVTYMVEIVYPQNRIVVQYDFSGLVLLAARVTATGKDLAPFIPCAGLFPYRAQVIAPTALETLASLDTPNSEGFVVHWPTAGLRLKIKMAQYVRLHRLLTGLSEKAIWELLKTGADLTQYLDNVPDEWMAWFAITKDGLLARYNGIQADLDDYWYALTADWHAKGYTKEIDRKAMALDILATPYPSLLFARLDGKTYAPAIWKMIEPKGQRTFHEDVDAL